jgi:hypothetical protein
MASRVVALVEHPASEDRKRREISNDARQRDDRTGD